MAPTTTPRPHLPAGAGHHHLPTPARRGFTLNELLIVMVIIAVIATIAIATFRSTLERSHQRSAEITIGETVDHIDTLRRVDHTHPYQPIHLTDAIGELTTAGSTTYTNVGTAPSTGYGEISNDLSADGTATGVAMWSRAGRCTLGYRDNTGARAVWNDPTRTTANCDAAAALTDGPTHAGGTGTSGGGGGGGGSTPTWPATAFVTTWDTTLPGTSAGDTISLALDGTVNATIDWGDGTPPQTVTTIGPHAHTYAAPGVYSVVVDGTVTGYNSLQRGGSDQDRLIRVDQWGDVGFTSMFYAFYDADNLTAVPATSTGLEAVTTMRGMFAHTANFNDDISAWNINGVNNLDSMFQDTVVFNGDISGWDTSTVLRMSNTFRGADAFNVDISGWDTSNVTTMYGMFLDADAFNQPIGTWNTANVTDMGAMFYMNNSFNSDVSAWDTSQVRYMQLMFADASSFNQPIGTWNTASAITMESMFRGATVFNADISGWNTIAVRDMSGMFSGAGAFTADISGWDVSAVTDFEYMFQNADSFNQPIGAWNTGAATTMRGMFWTNDTFTADISTWNTANVTNMTYMFYGATAFNSDLSGWCVTNITSLPTGFDSGTTSWTLPRPAWGTCP